jgi:glycolate oxidase iron-sulfur subunit
MTTTSRAGLPLLDGVATACALPNTPLADAIPGIDACVHCGFCLQACPTYVTLNDENDSPRGRILLMRGLVEGTLPLDDPDVGTHIDRCLGCRACETACPSGVPYGQLLEATRATMASARPRPFIATAILAIFARPALLSIALVGARLFRATGLPSLLARLLPGRLGFANAMLAASSPVLPADTRRAVLHTNAVRGKVALLEGCVMDGLFSHTNAATARVLGVNGYAVTAVRGQACCGALHAHAGDLEGARALARRNVAAFEASDAQWIAINAGGCGAMVKEYAHLLHDDPAWADRAAGVAARARDISELLAAAGPVRGTLPPHRDGTSTRVTYDPPCHLMHAQRITKEPLAVLAAIDGLTHVPLADADQCCGSAGIYNLIEPDVSDAVLSPKLAAIADSAAPYVATGNPGCLMQIGAGLLQQGSATRVVHPIDLLDAAYGSRASSD